MGPEEPRDPESGDLLNICKALSTLPDNAIQEMKDSDLDVYGDSLRQFGKKMRSTGYS
jgi:hypothetical protein